MVQVHACGAHVVHCNGMRIHSLFSVLELGFVVSGVILGTEHFAIFGEEGLIYQ